MSRREASVERKLLDHAAAATLEKIREDQRNVSERLRPLLRSLSERLLESDFDVNALKREHDIRDNNFSASFAEELGMGTKAYLNDCRLTVAARLLEGTTLMVDRVGKLCGFKNRNTFGLAFTAKTGLAPRDYRREHGLTRINAAELERGLAGLLDADRGKGLGRHLLGLGFRLGELYEGFEASLVAADRALNAADYGAALVHLRRAESFAREEGFYAASAITARFAVAWHGRGAARALDGDVDRGFIDLARAREAYASAGELPPWLRRRYQHLERLGVSCETDGALYDGLCPACRDALKHGPGRTLREHLRNALEPVPRDLEWFRAACAECYRVAWRAISAARLGFLDDAFQAAWLCEAGKPFLHDRNAPSSRGHFIAALAEVEASLHGNQTERLEFCDLALADALALSDRRLVAEARTWRASVLRAKGEPLEARAELASAKEACWASPWLTALHRRMEGLMEDSATNFQAALRLARDAARLYESLDSHLVGVLRVHEANALFFLGECETAIERDMNALGLLDHRRDPITARGAVPIHLAISFGSLGRLERAELALSQCRYDRKAYPGLAASEVFTRACLRLEQGRAPEALRSFVEAREGFEELHRARPAALVTSYSVEASALLGDRAGALVNTATAVRFFEAAGCTRDTLEALGKLRALLDSEALDVKAIRAAVRRLCRANGGWLPESS